MDVHWISAVLPLCTLTDRLSPMSSGTDGPLVLFIEEEVDVAQLVCHVIQQEQFKPVTAHSGVKGIQMAKEQQPKAIVLDLMPRGLDGLDGLDVLKRLKETTHTRAIPIIVLGAKSDPDSCIKALELGAEDYISKPFSNRELALRLRTALRRSQMAASFMSSGDLEVDPIALRVSIKGCPVDLSLLEFKLLCTLMSRAGEIIPRKELLYAVWGKDPQVESRSVDTYVYRVRNKLGVQGSKMTTVRGRGYTFQKLDQDPLIDSCNRSAPESAGSAAC